MQTCPRCGFSGNRDGARFCSNCAAPLASPLSVTCPRCGTENSPGARFCFNCASALTNGPTAGMTGLLLPNRLLQARYLIVGKIGQGGMGAVYQAQDARLQGKQWAIKEISDVQLSDPVERQNAIAAFRREAQLLATLDHANLPKVADFYEEGGRHYLVMDYVEGQTLEQVVASTAGFLSEATVLGWMEQLCNVLEYLHTRQPPIVFRDLKPGNIMLTREGKIKLIDFGIARFFKSGKAKDTAAYGTMGYAAPEQFGTGQTDARSDIYSLGVTLHFLLTKYDPSLTPFNLPPARNINPSVSPQVEAVIACATKSSAVERFQSAQEMRQALCGGSGGPAKAKKSTLRAPAIPPVKDYAFAPGRIATSVHELVGFCIQDWPRAVSQFYDGHFETWLKVVGEYGLASEVKRITDRRPTGGMEQSLGLQEWIDRTQEPDSHPALAVNPLSKSVNFNSVTFTSTRPLSLGTIEIRNQTHGVLVAQISASAPWLVVDQTSITCHENEQMSVTVFADLKKMPETHAAMANLNIISNGGSCLVPVTVSGLKPVLDLSLLTLEFGRVQHTDFRQFQIRNTGGRSLSGRVSTEKLWMTVTPGRFDGNLTTVTVQVDPVLLPKVRVRVTGEITISSNGGTKTVLVSVGPQI